MVSILDLHEQLDKVEEPSAEAAEFEFVLGRRQIASLLFVATVILMVCVAISYMAGKAMSETAPAAAPATVAVVREPDPPPIVLNQESAPEAPLFGNPKDGSIYIQMGAVEKGVSIIFAEGLRKHGLAAFVAPGPSEKIFRVLIGPLPDLAAYVKAKDTVDKIGLASFARKFPN